MDRLSNYRDFNCKDKTAVGGGCGVWGVGCVWGGGGGGGGMGGGGVLTL